jgi:hypothetical protein
MGKQRKPKARELGGDCTIPPPINVTLLPDFVFGQPKHEERRVREYMTLQARDESVIRLERVGSEWLLGRKMGFWDVQTDKRKWWVITNPTNLYAQDLFPSLDYTVSFHVGVTTRMMAHETGYEGNTRVKRITPTLKRLEAAADALHEADEAEKFQAIGMMLRESLLTLTRTLARPEYVPVGQEAPKASDFIHWAEHIADAVARGGGAAEVRGYLKSVAKVTWQLVSWLTHTSNAVLQDARLAHGAVETVVAAFWQAAEKHESGVPDRCPSCGSYRVIEDYRPDLAIDPPYVMYCERCDWISPKRVPSAAARAANAADRLAKSARLARPAPEKL